MYQKQDIEIGIRSVSGEWLFASDKLIQQFPKPVTHQEIIGAGDEFLNNLFGNNEVTLFCNKINELLCNSLFPLDTLIDNVRSDGSISFSTTIPLFDNDNRYVARRFLTRPVDRLVINEGVLKRYRARFNRRGVFLNKIFPISLTHKEEIVLGLLLLGYSQKQIAGVLMCSRSAVAKFIAEDLCACFEMSGSSSKLLVEKLISLGYDHWIPERLIFN